LRWAPGAPLIEAWEDYCVAWGRFPECLHVFEGLVAPLAPCSRSAECADGFCDTTSGACVARHKLGEYCPDGQCTEGLTCLSSATLGVPDLCAHALGDGSPCHSDSECASAFCNIDTATNTASCGPPTFCNGV
jgi:hypothetical protein